MISRTNTYQDADAREHWRRLVVKVLSWKDGLVNGNTIKSSNKITRREWNKYYQGILRINIIQGKEKTKQKLKSIKKIIKSYDGFE